MAEIPLISNKGDIRFSADACLASETAVSFSAGLTNNLAMQYYLCTQTPRANMEYTHFALGYYHPLEYSVAELFIGVGYGNSKNNAILYRFQDNNGINPRGEYTVLFVQPDFGFKNLTRAHIDVGLSLKAGLFFPSLNIRYHDDYHYNTTNIFFEPQIFFRIGGKKCKWSIQAGGFFPYAFNDPYELLYTRFRLRLVETQPQNEFLEPTLTVAKRIKNPDKKNRVGLQIRHNEKSHTTEGYEYQRY